MKLVKGLSSSLLFVFPKQISNGTSSVIVSRKRPSEGNYQKEKDLCIKYFDQWSESDQVEFVEHLISRMCHYQHGHINSYLKPMLQRDFITALPGNHDWPHSCWAVQGAQSSSLERAEWICVATLWPSFLGTFTVLWLDFNPSSSTIY